MPLSNICLVEAKQRFDNERGRRRVSQTTMVLLASLSSPSPPTLPLSEGLQSRLVKPTAYTADSLMQGLYAVGLTGVEIIEGDTYESNNCTFKGVCLLLGAQINLGCFSRSASVKGENPIKTLGYECCNSSGCIFFLFFQKAYDKRLV